MARTQIDASLVPTAQKLSQYKRPQLGFGGVTAVGLDNYRTSGGTNYSQIIFPDGQWREEGDTTRRTFIITRNAVLTNSGAQSGLRTGLSEANNTWYALYAVKITDSSSGFVVVGDTVQPTIGANQTTLDSNFGVNGWVYLGMIRNGDNADVAGDILDFTMSGNLTMFANIVNPVIGTSVGIWNGMELASGTGITSISWTYATGTSGATIPATCRIGDITSVHTSTANFLLTIANAPSRNFDYQAIGIVGNLGPQGVRTHAELNKGFQHNQSGSGNMAIVLTGFVDDALGVGANPTI